MPYCARFASRAFSRLLNRTAEFRKHRQKRYDDTAPIIAVFMQNGYDRDRGIRSISQMDKIHSLYKISNDDYLVVLSSFIFLPVQWVDNFLCRKTSENERLALYYFFRESGKGMFINAIPSSLEELNLFVDKYQEENFRYEKSNNALASATISIVKGWMPFFVKPFVLPVIRCLLDEKMLKMLGYKKPAPILKYIAGQAMKTKAFFLQTITFKRYPPFVSTEKNRTNPEGYQIEEFGTRAFIHKI